ncbi:E3 ubiquitin-protein ligase MBR1-like isoform X2 [Rutidosis leptorrhynchoides]|uniref:E3 ubiquitin-protein ligase MBR1-like isoform X2 n=2 Tax=Rutidosis leptorrhynchoides TaxID=125765 RepID=UPI003A9A595B
MEHGSNSSVVDQPNCWTNTFQDSQNVSLWTMGESSSSSVPTQSTTQHGWSSLMKPCPDPHKVEPLPSSFSSGDVHMNITHNAPHNATVNSSTSTFIGIKPSNYASSSSAPFEMANRQLPCKRKAVELDIGQSSSGSNIFQTPDNSTHYDRTYPGFGSGVGEVSSNNNAENTHRNVRIRINNPRQQESLPANNVVNNGQINFSSSHPSLEHNPVIMQTPSVGNLSTHVGQPVLRVPVLRRNLQTSRTRASHSSNIGSGSVDNSRPMATNFSDHPLFMQQPHEIRNTSTAINWSLNNNSVVPTSNTVAAAPSSTQPNVGPLHGSTRYPSRRLSEIRRRSSASSSGSSAGVVGGGQNGNLFHGIPPPVHSLHEAGNVPHVFSLHRHNLVHPRSSDRQLRASYGFPLSARVAGSEGRGRLMSEIRNVLDRLRRGEGLRIEDVMLLDQSFLYGMVDIHDRHRDMRLDIDNMSYEELLALEERIGNVNTGLTEENILSCLKQKAYVAVSGQSDTEPCCVCQEEYKNGDDLGSLKCGHDFHTNCIKQWLLQKNSCPVCKSSAFETNK